MADRTSKLRPTLVDSIKAARSGDDQSGYSAAYGRAIAFAGSAAPSAFAPPPGGDAVAHFVPSTVQVRPLTVQTNTVYKAGVSATRTDSVSDFTSLLWPTGDPAYPVYAINPTYGKPAYITYSFPSVKPDYVTPNNTIDPETGVRGQVTAESLAAFRGFSANEIRIVEAEMAKISAASGVVFLRVDDTTSLGEMPFWHIDFSKLTVPTAGGFAAAPGGNSLGAASDVYMDEHVITTVDVLLHEIGHALGLKHPHERTGNIAEGRQLAAEYDNVANTIMSYENARGTGLGPMDIQALRYLYGANLPVAGTDYVWDKPTETLTQFGTAGADVLSGTAANDRIDGGASNDTLVGKDGKNTLNGQDGDDTITGGNGENIFTGGIGNDTLKGGDGKNNFSGDDGNDTLTGGKGTDILSGGTGNDTLNGSSGNADYRGGTGNDTMTLALTAGKTFKVDGGADTDTLNLTYDDNAPDAFTLVGNVANVEQIKLFSYTNMGPDGSPRQARSRGISITLNDATGTVSGGDGNDVVNGAAGNFAIFGGKGDDTIIANANNGFVSGDDGNDTLKAGTGTGDLSGGTGADRFYGNTGVSFMNAGTTPGSLSDGARDTFFFEKAIYSTATATDSIGAFAIGEDKIDLTGLNLIDYTITTSGDWSYITGTENGVSFKLAIATAGVTTADVLGDDTFSSSLNLVGTAAGETLTGGASDDRIDGKGGADRLTGGAGKDVFVVSAAGDSTAAAPDTITDFVRGTDRIDLTGLDLTSYKLETVGATTVITGLRSQNTAGEIAFKLIVNTPGLTTDDVVGDENFVVDQVLTGTPGADTGATRLLAGRGNDTIYGLAGDDLINGMEGDDVIVGGAGADHLIGGNGNGSGTPQNDPTFGNDTFLFTKSTDSTQDAADYIQDFVPGEDKIRFQGFTLTAYKIETIGSQTIITGLDGATKFKLVVARPGITTDDIIGDEGFGTDVSKTGDAFNNTLEGGSGNDILSGLGGNDILRGLGGVDKLDGDTGDDTLEVTIGANRTGFVIDGGADTDYLGVQFANVDAAAQSLKLSELGIRNVENVTDVKGGAKNDTFTADISVSGSITMSGWGGNDVLTGSAGRDTLWGGEGNDTLIGNDGDDMLNGQQGIENLSGGKGNDNLSIELGTLTGGALPAGYVLDGGDGFDTLFVGFRDGNAAQTLKLASIPTTSIEKIVAYGGTADDTLDARGVTIATELNGGTGLASLYGGSADDALVIRLGSLASGNVPAGYVLNGGAGKDTLYVNFADDNVARELNVKSIPITSIELIAVTGGAQKDVLNAAGTTVRTDLSGMAGDDVLTAGSFGGALFGGDGKDRLIAGTGDNFMNGGADADTFVFGKITDSVRGASDTIGDFVRGVDKIDVTAIKFDAGTFTINRTVFDYSDGSQRIGTEIIGKANGVDFYVQVQNVHLDESDFEFKLVNGLKKLSDGYIAGATVYHDANGNGQLDDGEDFGFTDDAGNFELPVGGIGPIRGFGGVNVDTGLPNLLELSAPGDATVIDPLTTLVQALVETGEGEATATAQVMTALGIDPSIVIGQTDLLAAAGGGDAAALAAQKLAASIATIVVTGAASGGAPAAAVVTALADRIAQTATPLDLTKAGTLADIYTAAGLGAGANTAASSAASANKAIEAATALDAIADAQKAGALTGNDLDNNLTGGSGIDRLRGYGGDDRLDGGDGADVLVGGGGNDTFVVGSRGDRVLETAGAGVDHVFASVSYYLTANVEQLTLTGTAAIGQGNDLDNVITGNDSANRLDGGLGADRMAGGLGDDVYSVDQAGDVVIEGAGGGTDTVRATIDYILGDDVENLTLSGAATHGTGNAGANRIIGGQAGETIEGLGGHDILLGNAGDDVIDGGDGGDVIVGGAGRDTLTGGAGNDVFRFATGDLGHTPGAADVITDFTGGHDLIDLLRVDAIAATTAVDAFSFIGTGAFSGTAGELRYAISGGDTLIEGDTDGDAIADMMLHVTGIHALTGADFVGVIDVSAGGLPVV